MKWALAGGFAFLVWQAYSRWKKKAAEIGLIWISRYPAGKDWA